MRSLLLFTLGACTGPADTPPGDDSGGDTDTTLVDSGDTDPPKVDTGLALAYYEGLATLTPTSWEGTESWVGTSLDGAVEHCRVTNTVAGTPSLLPCAACAFTFDVTLGAGTAEGDACANLHMTADMFDGESWTYGYAPQYVYGPYGYTYEDVLLYGYEAGGEAVWWVAGAALVDSEGERIEYESSYSYSWTYFFP